MEKRIISIFTIFILFILSIQSVSALNVYLGLEIITLTDDPANGCINHASASYGPQGRIRAISSILPSHPLYFNLTNQSNGAQIWAGDSTKDTDYGPGEIIFLPNPIDLQSGVTYNLMMDIDAIRVYLPLISFDSFVETSNDEYWTAGKLGIAGKIEPMVRSSSCTYLGTYSAYATTDTTIFYSSVRGNLIHSCMTDNINYNCDDYQYIPTAPGGDFNVNRKYDNLYQPTVGNFNMQFTMP